MSSAPCTAWLAWKFWRCHRGTFNATCVCWLFQECPTLFNELWLQLTMPKGPINLLKISIVWVFKTWLKKLRPVTFLVTSWRSWARTERWTRRHRCRRARRPPATPGSPPASSCPPPSQAKRLCKWPSIQANWAKWTHSAKWQFVKCHLMNYSSR